MSSELPSNSPLRGTGLLRDGVGRRCGNTRVDVEVVQRLMNNAARQNVVDFGAPLVPDGLFGRKTEAAIMACETALLGICEPTGIINTDDKALFALVAHMPREFSAMHLSLIMPAASAEKTEIFAPPLRATFATHQINTPWRQAHFLAQIGHESGELRFQEELASGAAYEGRADLGNYQPGDGTWFKGRGLIQLTGRANYTAFARSVGREREILRNPSLVASDLSLCVGVAGWYWSSRGLNQFADIDSLRKVTYRVNGGYNGLAHRQALLNRAKALLIGV